MNGASPRASGLQETTLRRNVRAKSISVHGALRGHWAGDTPAAWFALAAAVMRAWGGENQQPQQGQLC